MKPARGKVPAQGPALTLRRRMIRISGPLQRLLAPGLKNSQYAYGKVLSRLVTSEADWLDLGCGHQLFPDWMPDWAEQEAQIMDRANSVTGIDLDDSAIRRHKHITRRVVGDLHRLPFKNASFHLVTANVVVEHIADPALLLAEAHRVLHPGGLFLFHTPNFLSYGTLAAAFLPQSWKNRLALLLQGRKEEDVYPTFYRINTRRAILKFAKQSGFTLLELRMAESSAQTFMLGPVVALELLLIRILRWKMFQHYRTNIIAILRKDSRVQEQPSVIRASVHTVQNTLTTNALR